ncbi:MAG: four helix bundle protein [Saprospiraceae bacterium]
MKYDALKEKSFDFAVRIVRLSQFLVSTKQEYVMSKQILRAGTNPGAMVRESKNAESDKDYVHKLSIGQKEIGETMYWLELLEATDYLMPKEFESIYNDAEEVLKLLTSSIKTKKRNMGLL